MQVTFNTLNYSNPLIAFKQNASASSTFSEMETPRHVDIVPVDPYYQRHPAHLGAYGRSDVYFMYDNGSHPVKSYEEIARQINPAKGLSANPGTAAELLKGKSNVPLGVSDIRNGAVIALYNTEKGTHAMYQPGPVVKDVEYLIKNINLVMPEGFDKAIIVPGFNPGTRYPVCNLFEAAKKINGNAVCEFKHAGPQLAKKGMVEFVSYMGDVYGAVVKMGTTLFNKVNSFEYQKILRAACGK